MCQLSSKHLVVTWGCASMISAAAVSPPPPPPPPSFCIKALSFHPVIFPDEGNCFAETLELIFFQILASVDDLGLIDGYT